LGVGGDFYFLFAFDEVKIAMCFPIVDDGAVLFVYFNMEFVHIGFKRQVFAIGIIALVKDITF